MVSPSPLFDSTVRRPRPMQSIEVANGEFATVDWIGTIGKTDYLISSGLNGVLVPP